MGPCMDIMKRNINHYEEQLVQIFGSNTSTNEQRRWTMTLKSHMTGCHQVLLVIYFDKAGNFKFLCQNCVQTSNCLLKRFFCHYVNYCIFITFCSCFTILEYRYFIMHLLISNIRTELRVLKNIHIFINCLLSGLTDWQECDKQAIREYMAENQSNWVTINILNYLPLKFLSERLYISCVRKIELNIYLVLSIYEQLYKMFCSVIYFKCLPYKKLKYVTTCVHLWVIKYCFQTVHWLSIPIKVCDFRKTPNLSWKFSLSPHQVKTQSWVLHLLFCKSATTDFVKLHSTAETKHKVHNGHC